MKYQYFFNFPVKDRLISYAVLNICIIVAEYIAEWLNNEKRSNNPFL